MAGFISNLPFFASSDSLRHFQITHRHIIFGIVSLAFIVTLYNFFPAFSHEYHEDPFTGTVPLQPAKPQPTSTAPEDFVHWASRAEEVKKAFQHAYHGYETYAAPMDNLRPLSNDGTQE